MSTSHDSPGGGTEDAASERQASLPRNVRLLGLASLVNDIAGEMIYPLIPTFLTSVLGADKMALGAVEGVADTTASVVKLYAGSLSDRLGKRKMFVTAGYALAAVSRPVIGIATAAWQVLAVRSADRFGKGIRTSARDAMIADATDPLERGRAFGFTRAMDHLGAAIGPALAFAFLWLWPGEYRALFLLAAVPGLAVVALVALGVRERAITTRAGKEFHLTLAPFDRRFRLYLVALTIFTLGNSSDAFLLVRASEAGVDNKMLPLLWGAFHIVKSGGSLVAGRAVDRLGPRPLIIAGWLIYAAIYVAFALVASASGAWSCFLVYGLFYALTEPAERTLVSNLVGPERQGLAFGWFNFAIGIAALPANLIFGWIYDQYGAGAAFVWGAALALVAAILMLGINSIPPPAKTADNLQ